MVFLRSGRDLRLLRTADPGPRLPAEPVFHVAIASCFLLLEHAEKVGEGR